MATPVATILPAAPRLSTSNANDNGTVKANSSTSSSSGTSALARSLTGTLAFYFKRPVRLFRPTRISAWTAFTEMATAQGHREGVTRAFLRELLGKQGWFFFLREAFPPLFVNSLVGFTLFSTYTLTESALRYLPPDTLSPYAIPAIAGGAAGAAQSIVSSPLDNVRALLAAPSSDTPPKSASTKSSSTLKQAATVSSPQQWRGWRHLAFRAFFPAWLTQSTPASQTPVRFFSNWLRSSWALFAFTLLRDTLGFATFFSIFELSRSIAQRAGRAVDRLQARLQSGSKRLGIEMPDWDGMLAEPTGGLIPRGWTGRTVQAVVIVGTGMIAGIGYGIVGRPFDRCRMVVWQGLQSWAKQRKKEQDREAEARAKESHADKSAEKASTSAATTSSIRAIAKSNKPLHPREATAPLCTSHKSRHGRLAAHETRLPLHPPRTAEPPKHPLREPTLAQREEAETSGPQSTSKAVPGAFQILREAYRKEGLKPLVGFELSQLRLSNLPGFGESSSIFSRRQLARSRARQAALAQASSKDGRPSVSKRLKADAVSLESLAEHPALGGTSIFDNLPDRPTVSGPLSHRKPRWWASPESQLSQARKKLASAGRKRSIDDSMAKWARRLSPSNIFRVIPPYAFGFLAYAVMSGDLSQ